MSATWVTMKRKDKADRNDTSKNMNSSMKELRDSYFKMYHAISWMEYQTASHSADMTWRDIIYINLIMFMDDCTVSKLADMLNLSKPAVTIKINNLIQQGIVIKTKSTEDARVNILTIAPWVYTLYSKEDRRVNRALEELHKEYTTEDLKTFTEILNKLSSALVDSKLDNPYAHEFEE